MRFRREQVSLAVLAILMGTMMLIITVPLALDPLPDLVRRSLLPLESVGADNRPLLWIGPACALATLGVAVAARRAFNIVAGYDLFVTRIVAALLATFAFLPSIVMLYGFAFLCLSATGSGLDGLAATSKPFQLAWYNAVRFIGSDIIDVWSISSPVDIGGEHWVVKAMVVAQRVACTIAFGGVLLAMFLGPNLAGAERPSQGNKA